LKKGASVHTKDARGETVAAIATRKGQVELLDVLKDKTPSAPSSKEKSASTATGSEKEKQQRSMDLHAAVQKDSAEKVKELLATGKYQVNAKNANGVTPLHIAAFRYEAPNTPSQHTVSLSLFLFFFLSLQTYSYLSKFSNLETMSLCGSLSENAI
jgi:ankyrin repeat protein